MGAFSGGTKSPCNCNNLLVRDQTLRELMKSIARTRRNVHLKLGCEAGLNGMKATTNPQQRVYD
jgi:hypothetical protein